MITEITKNSTFSKLCENNSVEVEEKNRLELIISTHNKYKAIDDNLKRIEKNQIICRAALQKGFVRLAIQNKELNQTLIDIKEELNLLKKEREEKAARKKIRANRNRLAKRQPITPEIYRALIKAVVGLNYKSVRLRVAFCVLTVTGIGINELLLLKVAQLKTLFQNHWIAMDHSKRGPANKKAFLTPEGRKLVKDRKSDFDFLFLMKGMDCYVFTSESNHNQMLRRETITKDVNKVMRSVSKSMPNQPNLTSYSFRIGYIHFSVDDNQ